MFRPVTVYAVVCDGRDCGTSFRFFDDEGDGQEHELHLLTPEISKADCRWLVSEGWQFFGGGLLCPPCVKARSDAVFARLEIDLTHTPLPLGEEADR